MSTVPVFQLYSRGQLHARAVRGHEAMPGRQGCGPSPPKMCYHCIFSVDSVEVCIQVRVVICSCCRTGPSGPVVRGFPKSVMECAGETKKTKKPDLKPKS